MGDLVALPALEPGWCCTTCASALSCHFKVSSSKVGPGLCAAAYPPALATLSERVSARKTQAYLCQDQTLHQGVLRTLWLCHARVPHPHAPRSVSPPWLTPELALSSREG